MNAFNDISVVLLFSVVVVLHKKTGLETNKRGEL